jgi:hypothetical protein
MNERKSKYDAITDFASLRWQREILLVGDGPDARTCNLHFVANVTQCYLCWDFISFNNRKIFIASTQTIDGQSAYLFYFQPLRELWRRRHLERQLELWMLGARLEALMVVAGWAVAAAGASRALWSNRDHLMGVVRESFPNIGVPDLEVLVASTRLEPGDVSNVAA